MKLIKLQKQNVRKYKDETYYKYVILVPKNIIDKVGWVENQKLKVDSVINKGLFLFPI